VLTDTTDTVLLGNAAHEGNYRDFRQEPNVLVTSTKTAYYGGRVDFIDGYT